MKNKFALIAVLGLFLVGTYNISAQESDSILTEETVEETTNSVETNDKESASFHQIIKQKFIEGGPGFMGIVLLCLILGLALAIERIIYLNMATTDTDKLLNDDDVKNNNFKIKIIGFDKNRNIAINGEHL